MCLCAAYEAIAIFFNGKNEKEAIEELTQYKHSLPVKRSSGTRVNNVIICQKHLIIIQLIPKSRGQPSSAAVKFACSASAAQGSPVWILGVDLHTAYQAMLWQVSHIYIRGRWVQILAQGQSSSAKRGGLTADVSSRLIFLKTKKQKKPHWGLEEGRKWLGKVPSQWWHNQDLHFGLSNFSPQDAARGWSPHALTWRDGLEAGDFPRRCKTLDVSVASFSSDSEDMWPDRGRKQGRCKVCWLRRRGAPG